MVSSSIDDILQLRVKGSKVAIVCDGWTSLGRQYALFGLLGFFIDQSWKLRHALLDVQPHNTSSTQDTINGIVVKVISQLQLQQDIIAYTADNAKNFSASGVTRKLITNFGHRNISNAFQVPCMAHALQLVEGDFYQSFHITRARARAELSLLSGEEIPNEIKQPGDDSISSGVAKVTIYASTLNTMC